MTCLHNHDQLLEFLKKIFLKGFQIYQNYLCALRCGLLWILQCCCIHWLRSWKSNIHTWNLQLSRWVIIKISLRGVPYVEALGGETTPPPSKIPLQAPLHNLFLFCFTISMRGTLPPPPPIEITPLVISMINSTNNKFIQRIYLELCLEVWSMMRHHRLRTRLMLPPFTPPSPVTPFRRGPVCRGQFGEVLSFLRPTVQTIIECPPPAGDNHGWVVFAVRTGFALGHRASTFHACAHLITTAVRYQLWAQGRYFVPEPNMVSGVTGRSPGERPHDGIAGESPA